MNYESEESFKDKYRYFNTWCHNHISVKTKTYWGLNCNNYSCYCEAVVWVNLIRVGGVNEGLTLTNAKGLEYKYWIPVSSLAALKWFSNSETAVLPSHKDWENVPPHPRPPFNSRNWVNYTCLISLNPWMPMGSWCYFIS